MTTMSSRDMITGDSHGRSAGGGPAETRQDRDKDLGAIRERKQTPALSHAAAWEKTK